MKEILDIIHKTIYQFFDVCGDDEEAPMSDKDELLLEVNKAICNNLKALEQEPLTDTEQRIFLAAMGREEKICREVDDKYPDKEPYEDSLVSVCRSIERKVKKALWK